MDAMLELQRLAKNLGELNIPLPAELDNTLAVWTACNAAATFNIAADFADQLTAGKLTPKNAAAKVREAAQALAAKDYAAKINQDVGEALAAIGRRGVRDEGDRIIGDLQPGVTDIVATLTRTADLIGYTPDPATVARLGPAASQALQDQRAALLRWKAVHKTRYALAQVGYGPAAQPTWYLAHLAPGHALPNTANPTELLDAGHQVKLNTMAESLALLDQQITEEDKARAAVKAQRHALDQRRRDEVRRLRNEGAEQGREMLARIR